MLCTADVVTALLLLLLLLPAGAGSFLHTQGQDMPWFQVLLLDVLAVYAASAALAVAALATGMRVLAASWYAARHSHHTAAAGTSAGSGRRKQE